jgi:hypothetical protein
VSAPARHTSTFNSRQTSLQRQISGSVPFGCCAVDGALALVFVFEFLGSFLLEADFVQG